MRLLKWDDPQLGTFKKKGNKINICPDPLIVVLNVQLTIILILPRRVPRDPN